MQNLFVVEPASRGVGRSLIEAVYMKQISVVAQAFIG